MSVPPRHLRVFSFVFGVVLLAFSASASADPPSRVARLGYLNGPVSLSPAGESEWVEAAINRPLTSGDRLWADRGARAEIQLGGAMLRIGADTALSVLNLDDDIVQLQLTQGALNLRVRRLPANQVFEIDTPNLAFTLRRPGQYRIDVDADGNATTILVRQGQGEVRSDGVAYLIDAGRPYRFAGSDLRERQHLDEWPPDDFDRWSSERDRRDDNSASARYVSPDVLGYQDLDNEGTWRVDATYGNVWMPSRVAAGWAPYRDGHWAWVDPWGWTWIDDAPWGFAVSHYGRWAHLGGGWAWVPGPVASRAYYAPALVVFVGGSNFQIQIASSNVNAVAWFPLAPREVYRPAYPVSRGYFENVNRSNTVINTTVVNNTYNNINVTHIVYANRQVAGAVVAVPATAFVQSQQVAKAAQSVPRDIVTAAPLAAAAPVAPTEKSVRGAGAQRDKPPARVFERPVVARSAPPPAHAGFAAQQALLETKPGQPLDDNARRQLKRTPDAPAPVVKLVTPAAQAPQPLRESSAEPPATPPRVTASPRGQVEPQGRPDKRVLAPVEAPVKTPEPMRKAQTVPATQAPTPAAEPQARQRGNSDRPVKPPQRERPDSAPTDQPQDKVQDKPQRTPSPVPAAAPGPVVRRAEPPAEPAVRQRGNSEQPGKAAQRGRTDAVPDGAPKAAAPEAPAASNPAVRKSNEKSRNDRNEPDPDEVKGKPKP